MKRPRLTARARLTLLYTGLFAVCGAVVVSITYALAANMPVTPPDATYHFDNQAAMLVRCTQVRGDPSPDPALAEKCDTLLQYEGARSQRDATVSHLLQYSLITLGAVILLGAVAGWIVAGRVLRPVHKITAAARAASERNLSTRVALRGPRDELRELAETFDGMLDRLETAFTSQQRFIANASHELRTPLTIMRTTVDVVLAKPDRTPAELRTMAHDIRAAVADAEALVEALLTLARNEHGLTIHDEVDLATAAENVLDGVDVADRRMHASLEPAGTTGDPVLLERLIANLVENAVRYNIPGGDIWINTSTDSDQARLEVANTGPLIDPAVVDRLFQPFQRLADRTARDGFGLGLAIVASIVAVHHGTITANPRHGGGLTITVTLPAANATALTPTEATGENRLAAR